MKYENTLRRSREKRNEITFFTGRSDKKKDICHLWKFSLSKKI